MQTIQNYIVISYIGYANKHDRLANREHGLRS